MSTLEELDVIVNDHSFTNGGESTATSFVKKSTEWNCNAGGGERMLFLSQWLSNV